MSNDSESKMKNQDIDDCFAYILLKIKYQKWFIVYIDKYGSMLCAQ